MTDYLRHDDITIPQGTTFAVYWPLFAADGVTPLVTTGWTARAMARRLITDPAALVSWTTADALAFATVAGQSRLTLTIAAATSTAWTWGSAYFDVELVTATGEVLRLTQGRLSVDREVTR